MPNPCGGVLSTWRQIISAVVVFFLVAVYVGGSLFSRPSQAARQQVPATTNPKVAADFVPGEILVRFRDNARLSKSRQTLSVAAAGRQISVQLERLESGSEIVSGLRLGRVEPQETLEVLKSLRARADVLYAEPNYILRKLALPNDPRFNEQWALKSTVHPSADIDAEQAWDVTTGSSNVVVGVIDEGIDINHQDLAANIWTNPGEIAGNAVDDDANGFTDDIRGWDFVHNDNSVYDGPGTNPDGSTVDGHGTSVAGILGAVGNNSVGITGVSWQVKIVPMKFLGPNGGTTADSIRAYDYARNLKQAWETSSGARGANIKILNNSYGGIRRSQAALDAVRALSDAGILFVAAAGNDARDNDRFPVFPANYSVPNIVTVAATGRDGSHSTGFSNYGQRTVDMHAPGEDILTTIPTNGYEAFDGTSGAAPHASGTAALVLAAHPSFSMTRLRAALVYGGASGIPQMTSSGRRVNARTSLENATENDSTAPAAVGSPQATSQGYQRYALQWFAPGDDGSSNGSVSIYQVRFSDTNPSTPATFDQAFRLPAPTPLSPGSQQNVTVTVPFRHTAGFIGVRAIDNVGNAGPISVIPLNPDIAEADPYTVSQTAAETLSTGGTPLGLHADDQYFTYQLPFEFSRFSSSSQGIVVSTNGALHFAFPSQLPNGEPDIDVNSVDHLGGRPMIAGIWDDLRTDRRAGDDVYVVIPDPTKVIFRWQAVTYDSPLETGGTRGEHPVNFEIELRRNGTIVIRYGDGNHNLLPVVGTSAGVPDAYVIDSHTSETALKDLAFAQTVTFTPRRPTPLPNPDLFIGLRTTPAQAVTGQQFTYLIDAGNRSFTQRSEQTVVTNQLPAGTTFLSCATTLGTCTGPAIGSTGTVTVQLGTLNTFPNNLSSAQITITVMVTAPVGSSITETSAIAGFWSDSDTSNNSASATTEVRGPEVFGSVTSISAGSNHNLALKSDGRVWAWGYNIDGQLGDGTSSNTSNVPVFVVALSSVTAIDGGGAHSLALKSNGTVWAWGSNNVGQAGAQEQFTSSKIRATQVAGLSGQFTKIAAGVSHSLALRSDGTVWGFGANSVGQLGNGTTTGTGVYTPVQAVGLTNVTAIAAGNSFSVVLKSDGTVWAFGTNQSSVLGQPTSTLSSSTAIQISSLTNVAALSTGTQHGLALKQDGTVWAWGDNSEGQLGSGEGPGTFATPRQVSSLSNITAITAGSHHSLALKSDGTVWAWGRNLNGELGNGGSTNSNVPVAVNGINAVAVMAGLNHSGALLTDGTIRTWGKNDVGQLGDRTNVNRPTPVEVGASFGVATPNLNPDGGTFNNTIGVSTNSATPGCIIYYTTDGSEPTENDPALSNGGTIVVSRSMTLKVKAFKAGWPASQTKIANFVLPTPSPTPTPTPIQGSRPIAFARTLGNGADIFLMNSDGSSELNLSNNPGDDKQPSWSPNGTQLAFATYRTGDNLGKIALIRSDGTDLRIVDRHFGTSDSSPAWSSDGTKIALVTTFPASGASNISVMSSDTFAPLNSTNNSFGISLSPTWSPDGTKIAYSLNSPQQPAEIVVSQYGPQMFIQPQNLTNNSADDILPDWSPDGTKIAFTSNRDGNYEIYVMNADGTNPQRLTTSAGADRAPSWSPDGTKILFTSERDGGLAEIYVMNANGTNAVRLTNNSNDDASPAMRQSGGSTIQFSSGVYSFPENGNSAVITVTRTGDLTGSASVDYQTEDDPAPIRCDDTVTNQNRAYARCDYATTVDTLTFASGEFSKTFSIPLVDDAYAEGVETLQLRLSNTTGANLGTQTTAFLRIVDDNMSPGTNPINSSPFFVRQQYLDFLSREPEQAGFDAWLSVLNGCSDVNNNPVCDRITVSSSFFRSQEFQLKGFFVFKFYRLTLNRLPTYAEIAADMRKVTGQTSDEVFAKRDAFTRAWVLRQDFRDRFDQLNNGDFVDRLLRNAGIEILTNGATRESLLDDLQASRKTRTEVLRTLIEHQEVDAAQYNGAFVAMQYYGYLRRTPEAQGYQNWLTYLNTHPGDFREMVNGFMNSTEYRLRFGP